MTDPAPTITRADLAEHLVATGAMTRKTAVNAIGDLIAAIAHHLCTGAAIHLKGLGRFEIVATAERPGRNPKTGVPAVIPAGRRVKFKPSKRLLRPPPRAGEGRGAGESP